MEYVTPSFAQKNGTVNDTMRHAKTLMNQSTVTWTVVSAAVLLTYVTMVIALYLEDQQVCSYLIALSLWLQFFDFGKLWTFSQGISKICMN